MIHNKNYILGADECGTGSLVSCLVVSAVKAPKDWNMIGLQDSKKLKTSSVKKLYQIRDQLLKKIDNGDIFWSLAEQSHINIDQFGLACALKDAYVECFQKLYCEDTHIIADGTLNFKDYSQVKHMSMESLIKADTKIPTVMAASILGKCYRDEKMAELDKDYPVYGWEQNCGYSSKFHLEAIAKYGISPHHRMSFAPMRNMPKTRSKIIKI